MQKLIYIASPYTVGDTAANVAAQMDAAHKVMDLGHTPVVPLLDHFLDIYRRRPYEEWLACCMAKVAKCDIVWRLPGESPGADKEVEHAVLNGVTVVFNESELKHQLNQ